MAKSRCGTMLHRKSAPNCAKWANTMESTLLPCVFVIVSNLFGYAKSRFFHLEFFRLKTAKPSLGNAGDILGLEVNMRPAGGYTVDMLNYAGGLDLYQIWADMVAFGAAHHPLARYHRYCCCAGRHDELRYRMPHEELLKKYRSCLNAAPRLPEVLAREMGDQLYIASFEDEAAMQAFRRDALARPRE